jgi:hypothetical protein
MKKGVSHNGAAGLGVSKHAALLVQPKWIIHELVVSWGDGRRVKRIPSNGSARPSSVQVQWYWHVEVAMGNDDGCAGREAPGEPFEVG